MSILNSNVNAGVIHAEAMPFGAPMIETALILERAMTAAALDADMLLCGGRGRISLHRIDDAGQPTELSSLAIDGNGRQIGVSDGFAYVSTRESGVYVCDFTNPIKPVLAHHIDSLELATGIAVGGGLLAITNRHMGCELYDVRDPYHPRRLGDFYCGEAQSVWLHEKYAYVSHWMGREVRIFDISDPAHAKELAHASVDGFADGICVIPQNGRLLCLAATGHHANRLKNRRKYQQYTYVTAEMIAEGWGGGHGVEIFDVTDPTQPEWLGGFKAPPMFGGPDTWLVYSDGKTCVFTDSMNGVFTLSLDDPLVPVCTGHYRLKPLARQSLTPPSVQVQTGCITGAASVNGFLCAASDNDGVHILHPNQPLGAFIAPDARVDFDAPPLTLPVLCRSEGQLHGFVEFGGRIYCAAGEAGIEVRDTAGTLLETKKTRGICHDILLHDGFLYTAEGDAGTACYEIGTLAERSRADGIGCVRQIVAVGNALAVQIGCGRIAKLTAERGMLAVTAGEVIAHMLYHRHLSRTTAGGYLAAMPLGQGAIVISMDGAPEKLASQQHELCPFDEGACGCGEKLIVLHDGRYVCLDDPLDVPQMGEGIAVAGAKLKGIPYVLGGMLVVLNRCTGTAELLDIADVHQPKFLRRIETGGHPEACGLIGGEIYAALGFGGIMKL